MGKYFYFIFIFCVTFTTEHLYAQVKSLQGKVDLYYEPEAEDLNVFTQWITWNNPGSLLINHLTKQAENYYELRDKEIAKLKSKSDWIKRQDLVKEKLGEMVGPFPKKTPLNPRITGTIKREGYTIEKIVYESMPRFYVSGCIFIPDKIDGKAPAIQL